MVYGKKNSTKSFESFLNISAYGQKLVFVTNQAIVLLNTLFPPLGLMTACFVGLSSFLLLVGIYSAAVSVSNDVRIRKAIRSSIEKESELIGDKKIHRWTDEDIKDYTNKVIQEVIRRKVSK